MRPPHRAWSALRGADVHNRRGYMLQNSLKCNVIEGIPAKRAMLLPSVRI